MHIIGFANIKSDYFLQFHYNEMLSVEYSIFTKINYEPFCALLQTAVFCEEKCCS